MREDTITTKVYPFNELTDEAKQEAYGQIWDINVNYEWWESTYEDAANVGIKITEFDIDRGAYCKGDFTLDAEEVANRIIEDHGKSCETWNTANEFIAVFEQGKKDHESADDYDPDYELFVKSDYYGEIVVEFKRFILEDYRIMLQHEYEYLTSEEAIVETIEANEYEFTADGKLYR